MKKKALRGEPGIVTCSALKRSYRERLRGPNVIFVFLNGTREVIDSQLAALEPPTPDENVLEVNLAGTPAEEAAQVLHALEGRISPQPGPPGGGQQDS